MLLPISLLHAGNFVLKKLKGTVLDLFVFNQVYKELSKGSIHCDFHIVQPCYMEDWRTAVTVRERRRRTPLRPLYSLMTGCPSSWITRWVADVYRQSLHFA